MALAALGKPVIPTDDFFNFKDGVFEFKSLVPERFCTGIRLPNDYKEYSDLASSTQAAFEEGIVLLANHAFQVTRSPYLAYSGGSALNAVANRRIIIESEFERVFVPPCPDDGGVSVGAALWGASRLSRILPDRRLTKKSFGKKYGETEIDRASVSMPNIILCSDDNLVDMCVDLIVDGKVLGVFDSGSELGPRALGHRSILCDPRRPDIKDHLNRHIKFREGFQPFAPVSFRSAFKEWYGPDELSNNCKFMETAVSVVQENLEKIPGAVHCDGSARLQTIEDIQSDIFGRILMSFYNRTGIPVLINTSFNVKGEPIVETPEDALRCMLLSGMDACIIEERIFLPRDIFWDPLEVSVSIAGDVSLKDATLTFTRITEYGPDVRHFDIKSNRARAILFVKDRKGAREYTEFLRSVNPRYQSYGLRHVLALELRQGWISLDKGC